GRGQVVGPGDRGVADHLMTDAAGQELAVDVQGALHSAPVPWSPCPKPSVPGPEPSPRASPKGGASGGYRRVVPSVSSLSDAQANAVRELVRLSPVLVDLGQRFAEAGHALHLVGGSVRDALLGRLGDDLDLTTPARPEQVLALASGWADAVWETGIAYGTVGLRKGALKLEVTTYRAEAYAPDSRKPAVAYGEVLADDLARRDLSINAMAIAFPDWQAPDAFVDPYGGLEDLAGQVLRTPGSPEDSFGDDPLRMLRVARFASQLGFTAAPEAVAAMTAMADRLEIISRERVKEELSKLLLGDEPRRGLELLVDTGLAAYVLPELPGLQLEIDEHHQHKDVYEHTLQVLERAQRLEEGGPDLVLRMAALLHDVGKPRTRRHEDGGGVSFHHHEVVGAKMARKRLRELTYGKDVVDAVTRLTELHLRFHGYGEQSWTDSAVRRYVTDAGDQLDRLHKLVRSDCTTRNRRKAARLAAAYDELEERIARLREQEELDRIRPDLSGEQVMALLGLPPSREVGRALKHLLALRMELGPLGEERATAELRAWAAGQGLAVPPA
ncbi:MAG: tRNA nucleotidyltransferase, partial [Frankiales bacterium]|nr:tRNA nucleotidyltransferase [Frankiales bacterium]